MYFPGEHQVPSGTLMKKDEEEFDNPYLGAVTRGLIERKSQCELEILSYFI